MHTQNTTHWLRLIMDCEENGRGIDHFLSYMHTQNTTHLLKLIMDWEEKGKAIGHFLSYMYTQITQLTRWKFIIMDWEEKGRGIGHFQSYICTQITQLTRWKLIMEKRRSIHHLHYVIMYTDVVYSSLYAIEFDYVWSGSNGSSYGFCLVAIGCLF